jgi:hypothetical protein
MIESTRERQTGIGKDRLIDVTLLRNSEQILHRVLSNPLSTTPLAEVQPYILHRTVGLGRDRLGTDLPASPLGSPTRIDFRVRVELSASQSTNEQQGRCGGGPICDHPSGPRQYFLTKLPTEIQFLGSRPAEIHVFVNFALCEVCTVSLSHHYSNSTLGYVRQVLLSTKKNKLTSSRSSSTADHGVWLLDFNNKNRLKNLVTSLISLCSNISIRAVLVGLLGLPSRNRDCHGQHAHGGPILPNSRKMQLDNILLW